MISASCPSGILRAVVAVDEQRADRVEAVAPIVAQAHDEIEPALTDPDLRRLFPDQPDPHGADHVAWRQADARGRLAVDGDLQLRQAGQLLRAQIGDAVDAANQSFGLLGKPRQLVEIRTEDPHGQIRGRAAEPLVDAHAQRRREQHRDARHAFEPLAHVRLDLPRGRERGPALSTTRTSDSVCGIGSSVRSARPVRRTTSSTSGTSRSTSSTRWFRRSTSSSAASAGSTVCSRNAPSSSCGMKSLPMRSAERDARDRDQQRSTSRRAPDAAGIDRALARTTA